MRKIGENIRFYRNLRSLTQTALARQVKVAPAYISQIEANQRVPSLKVTRRIAGVLGIDMSVLVREADPRAQEGRLSDSEKLDLLRTLIMAIEGESRQQEEEEARGESSVAEVASFVVTEIHSEPSYGVFLREFTGGGAFGRESEDGSHEWHLVLEGAVRTRPGPGPELHSGQSLSPADGEERPVGLPGARVLSVYTPRVPLRSLVAAAEESPRPSS